MTADVFSAKARAARWPSFEALSQASQTASGEALLRASFHMRRVKFPSPSPREVLKRAQDDHDRDVRLFAGYHRRIPSTWARMP
jgi:hypothetical protein